MAVLGHYYATRRAQSFEPRSTRQVFNQLHECLPSNLFSLSTPQSPFGLNTIFTLLVYIMSLDDGRREHFDEMDAILNDYDRSLDEILGAADNAQHNNPRSAADRPPEELGIDEEVKVQKNRKRAPKLDETL